MKKIRLLAVLLALLGLQAVLPIYAQSNNQSKESITVSPATSKPQVKAGQTLKGEFTVINDGTQEYKFITYARPFSVKGDDYEPNFTVVNKHTEIFQWIKLDSAKESLKPDERVKVAYTINVPEDARPGGHYAVIFAETQPPANSGSIVRKKRVGSILYATVDGEIEKKAKLEKFESGTLFIKPPITSDIYIKNEGNVHFSADINLNYKSIFGKNRFTFQESKMILPGTTRRIPVKWEKPPLFGIFKTEGSVNMIGQTQQLPEKLVILLPLPVIIIAILILALIILIPLTNKRKRTK